MPASLVRAAVSARLVSHNPPVAPAKRTSLPKTVRSPGSPRERRCRFARCIGSPSRPSPTTPRPAAEQHAGRWQKTVRSLGLSPEVPAISWVPPAVPFVTHNPIAGRSSRDPRTAPRRCRPSGCWGRAPQARWESLKGPLLLTGVNSKVPLAVPFVSHRPGGT